MKFLLKEFMNSEILTSQQCDTVLSQFNGFMKNEIKELKRDSFKFNHQNDCLDDFYFQHARVHNYRESLTCTWVKTSHHWSHYTINQRLYIFPSKINGLVGRSKKVKEKKQMQNKKRHLLQLILKKILQKFKIREKAVVLMEEEVRKYMELEDGNLSCHVPVD